MSARAMRRSFIAVAHTEDTMTTFLARPLAAARIGRWPLWRAPVLVGLLGFAISLAGAWIPSIWYDEAATITSSTRSWTQLWAEIGTVDLVHALYYAGMHVWLELVGYSPLTLRLPSALAVGAAAALLVLAGRQLGRARLGVLAGVVFSLLPRTTWAGAEGRSYALTALLAIALTVILLAGCRATAARARLWWIAYAALAVVAILTFVYLALVVVAHVGTMLWWWRSDPRLRRRIRAWFIAVGAAALVGSPFLLAVSTQSGQVQWLGDIGSTTIVPVLRSQWFMSSVPFAIVGWLGIVVGSALLLRTARGRRIAAVAIPSALLPTALLLVASALVTPLYNPRYLTLSLPFVALLIAAAIDALRPRLAIVALAVVAVLAGPQVVAQRSPMAKEHTDWASVAALVAQGRDATPGGTAIIFGTVEYHPSATARVISYSYPDEFEGTVDVTLDTPAAETGRLWETELPLRASLDRLNGAQTVYLLTSRAEDDTDATTAVIGPLGWSITDDRRLGDVRMVTYTR